MSESPERITGHIWKRTGRFHEWECERCNSHFTGSREPNSNWETFSSGIKYSCEEMMVRNILDE